MPKKHYMQYCQVTSESQILKKQDLFTAFDPVEPSTQPKKGPSQQQLQKTAAKFEEVLKQMNELSVSMCSEIKPVNELQVSI